MMTTYVAPQSIAPTSTRREIPPFLKVVLFLKALGALVMMGLSFLALLAWSDPASRPVGMSSDFAHRIANLAMLAAGASLLELLGVAGTWSMKRWGVYILAGFTMMGFVFRVHSDNLATAILSVSTTIIVGFVVASHWKDFE